ncbi:hypothetical protein [Solidesulfovibrio sp.]|uniref:hypothetical protein n=1 Tax=Solidesulfovibrio sp. TaxID=2910990 RepID=UPI002602C79D|nr:hypothetical protein [Solidesulfovibrio sp.]
MAGAYLVEIEAHVPASWIVGGDRIGLLAAPGTALATEGRVETLRFSSGVGLMTRPDDEPPNTYYEPRVAVPFNFERLVFQDGVTAGAADAGYGEIELSNPDGVYDYLAECGLDGRRVCLLYGEETGPLSGFEVVFVGTMTQPEFSWHRAILPVRDRAEGLRRAIQQNVYAGDNEGPVGVEGDDSLKDKTRPLAFGRCRNVPATCVNGSTLTYQVHDGQVAAIPAVYDKAMPLTPAGDYPTAEALAAATFAAGQFATCLARGLFRLLGKPAGAVTADVDGDATGGVWAASVAAIIRRIALTRAGLAEAELDLAAFDALEVACPAVVSCFLDGGDKSDIDQVFDDLCANIGAWWCFDRLGRLTVGRFEAPAGEPAATLTTTELLDGGQGLEILPARDLADGVPVASVSLEYQRNWYAQQADDLAGGVDDTRRAWLAEENRTIKVEDAAIREVHLLAPELAVATCLDEADAARAEAVRLLALHGVPRQRLRLPVKRPYARGLDLGSVIAVRLPRFGLSEGRLFTVIGMTEEYETGHVTLEVWG